MWYDLLGRRYDLLGRRYDMDPKSNGSREVDFSTCRKCLGLGFLYDESYDRFSCTQCNGMGKLSIEYPIVELDIPIDSNYTETPDSSTKLNLSLSDDKNVAWDRYLKSTRDGE